MTEKQISEFGRDISERVGWAARFVVADAIPTLQEIALRRGWSQEEANEVSRFVGTLAVDVGVAVARAVADYFG